jgi:hypothetical protein
MGKVTRVAFPIALHGSDRLSAYPTSSYRAVMSRFGAERRWGE